INAATTVLAYQIAITRPTDIVITERHCTGSMTGLELTRRLRIHTRTTTVPIIVITSETRRRDGRVPRRLSRKHALLDSLGNERTCRQCWKLMEYRHRSPILSAVDPN